jgi:hypothetical protein
MPILVTVFAIFGFKFTATQSSVITSHHCHTSDMSDPIRDYSMKHSAGLRTTLPKRQALQQLDGSVQIKFAK